MQVMAIVFNDSANFSNQFSNIETGQRGAMSEICTIAL